MKRTYIVSTLCFLFLLNNSSVRQAAQHPIPPPAFLVSKLALTLVYRGPSDAPLSNLTLAQPYAVGVFPTLFSDNDGNPLTTPQFVSTDWKKDIYIFDPMTQDYSRLKVFSSHGKCLEAWQPISARAVKRAAVTKSGYIWLGLDA